MSAWSRGSLQQSRSSGASCGVFLRRVIDSCFRRRTYGISGTEERQDAATAGTGSTAVATSLPPDFNGVAAGKHAPADDLVEAWRDSVPVVTGTEERQDAAAAGTGSTAVATSLPPDFSGAAAGKHAPADDLAEASRDSVPVERDCVADPSLAALVSIIESLKSGRITQVVVLAGAGISTASGIPDFRTPGTGLYYNLQKYNLTYAEAIFDIEYFLHDPEPFFTLAQELYPSGKYRPNAAHYFVRLLHDKELLLRMYTQNIDGLERLAGLPPEKLVEAHGTFATATCIKCREPYNGEDIKDTIFSGEVPMCRKEKCNGVVKPDIVFFGEALPERFYSQSVDFDRAELLLILGTSLQVYPFAGLAKTCTPDVPRMLFNREVPPTFHKRSNDVFVEGDIVKSIRDFCRAFGWLEDLDRIKKTHEDLVFLTTSYTKSMETQMES